MMSKVKIAVLMVALLCGLVLVSTSSAMSSAQYGIGWHVVGAGGSPMRSATYGLGGTAGQPAVGHSHSASGKLCAGYWCGAVEAYRIYLPLVLRGV